MSWIGDGLPLYSVEPEGAPTLASALRAGSPIDVDVSGLAADSLGARRIGQLCFDLATALNPLPILVSDEAIVAAQRWLYQSCCQIAEPGGATALAALMTGRIPVHAGMTVGVIICGGNANVNAVAG